MVKNWDLPPHLHDHTYCKTDRKQQQATVEFVLIPVLEEQQHGQLDCPPSAGQQRAGVTRRRRRKRAGRRRQLRGQKDSQVATVEEEDSCTCSTSRPSSEMFFPKLEDSSLRAEAGERRRREARQQQSLRALDEPLDERFIRNAAVLPDWRPPEPSVGGGVHSPHPELDVRDEPTCLQPPKKKAKH